MEVLIQRAKDEQNEASACFISTSQFYFSQALKDAQTFEGGGFAAVRTSLQHFVSFGATPLCCRLPPRHHTPALFVYLSE